MSTTRLIFLLLAAIALDARASDAWQLILTQQGVSVYKGEASSSSTIPFKANAIIDHPIEKVFKVLTDANNKNKWAPKLKSVKMHDRGTGIEDVVFSEYYKTPWPAYDREFLLKGTIKKRNGSYIILSAISHKDHSLSDRNHVLARVDKLNLYLKRIDKGQTFLEFEFHGDMMGFIPKWLSNIIQKKWPLKFILGLKSYLNKERKLEL